MAIRNNPTNPFSIIFYLCLIQFTNEALFAQAGYLPKEDFSGAAYTLAVHEVNFEGVDSKSSARLPYDRIKGSPYNVDGFTAANFFKSVKGKWVGTVQARLNLATHEVHFIGENGKEFIAPAELSGVVEFGPKEKYIRNVFGLMVNNKPLLGYAQELVDGEATLLKFTKRYVASADSMFGTLKRYYFASNQYYFIQTASTVTQLKKMSQDILELILPPTGEMNLWIKKNALNFRREEDVIKYVQEWNRFKSLSNK